MGQLASVPDLEDYLIWIRPAAGNWFRSHRHFSTRDDGEIEIELSPPSGLSGPSGRGGDGAGCSAKRGLDVAIDRIDLEDEATGTVVMFLRSPTIRICGLDIERLEALHTALPDLLHE